MTKLPSYKHALSVTGQVFFCSAPVRFDSYDGCQFGCVYCFSRKRSRLWSSGGVHTANVEALDRRFKRIAGGRLQSALDEMLCARVPVQLGGLQDPFTERERRERTTLRALRVFAREQHPLLISTKADLVADPNYSTLLRDMNVVVRFSAAGVKEKYRAAVEKGCMGFDRILESAARLSAMNVPVALRIQPVVPGFEENALGMARRAADAGVRQVSFEFLKVPRESIKTLARQLHEAVGFDVVGHMRAHGLAATGWDGSLPRDEKLPFVREARRTCRSLGLAFGAGDTEFIPWSDGDGCCGSSSLFLKNSLQFTANFVGAIRSALRSRGRRVSFQSVLGAWAPERPISTYLSSKSRRFGDAQSDWLRLLARRWNGDGGIYSPSYFAGVQWQGEVDQSGYRVYDAGDLSAELSGARRS